MSKYNNSSKSTLCRIKITAAYIYSLIAVMESDSTEESHRFLMQENLDGQPGAILYETCLYNARDGAYDYFERSAL